MTRPTRTRAAVASLVSVGAVLAPLAGGAAGAETQRLGLQQVLFASLRDGNDDIYLVAPGGGGERQLTHAPGQDGSPQASPDRQRIAFASEREGLMQIYLMNADGSDQHNIGNSEYFDFNPRWYAGGERIVFQRLTPGSGFDLWTMAADGSDQQRLTSQPRNEVGPSVSPDGTTVVFMSNNGASVDVWTVPLAGGSPTNVTAAVCIEGTDPCQLALDGQARWMPDGRLVFLSDRTGGLGIWTSAADGSDARLVVDLGEETSAGAPAPSANGRLIAFISDLHEPGAERNVYTVRIDGTDITRLTFTGDDLSPGFAGQLSKL
jgi:Tol biopolymer transport system component